MQTEEMSMMEQREIALAYFETALKERGMRFHSEGIREINNKAISIGIPHAELMNFFKIEVYKLKEAVFGYFPFDATSMDEDRKGEIARRLLKYSLQEKTIRFVSDDGLNREIREISSKSGISADRFRIFYQIVIDEVVTDFFKRENEPRSKKVKGSRVERIAP